MRYPQRFFAPAALAFAHKENSYPKWEMQSLRGPCSLPKNTFCLWSLRQAQTGMLEDSRVWPGETMNEKGQEGVPCMD